MLTALVLQLIQCVVALPEKISNKNIADSGQSDNVKNVGFLLIAYLRHFFYCKKNFILFYFILFAWEIT